ncbi:Scr1 family TA system antitoxin-like transcriptional regulator [Micromonospora sp. NPDC023888]
MAEQLTILLEAQKRWNVTIQVIPFREGAYTSMVSSFHILGFKETP